MIQTKSTALIEKINQINNVQFKKLFHVFNTDLELKFLNRKIMTLEDFKLLFKNI